MRSHGDLDRERAAFARLTGYRDGSAVCLNDRLDNTQAKAAALHISSETLIHLVKPMEDATAFSRGDTDAIVLHGEENTAVSRLCLKHNPLLITRILPSIIEEINQRGRERIVIRCEQRKVGSNVRFEMTIRPMAALTDRGDSIIHDLLRTNGLKLEGKFVSLQPREREEIVDQSA